MSVDYSFTCSNDIYKNIVFGTRAEADDFITNMMGNTYWINSDNGCITTVYDLLVELYPDYDDNDIVDETEYGWDFDNLCRFKIVALNGRYLLILPRPISTLILYDEFEKSLGFR